MDLSVYGQYIMNANIISHLSQQDTILVDLFINSTITDCYDFAIVGIYNNSMGASTSNTTDRISFEYHKS